MPSLTNRIRPQRLVRPKRLPPRTPLSPEEILALKEQVQYNKTRFAELVHLFQQVMEQCRALNDYTPATRGDGLRRVSRTGQAESMARPTREPQACEGGRGRRARQSVTHHG